MDCEGADSKLPRSQRYLDDSARKAFYDRCNRMLSSTTTTAGAGAIW